jgi:hypothetical protein
MDLASELASVHVNPSEAISSIPENEHLQDFAIEDPAALGMAACLGCMSWMHSLTLCRTN